VKSVVDDWNIEGHGVIAHSLSEGDGNEFVSFLDQRMDHEYDTLYILSSQNSTHRWNPFDDYDQDMQSMRSIADGLWSSRDTVETGWSDSARALLTAALAVTSAITGDFADLPDVLEDGPETIIDHCQDLPDGRMITSSLESMSGQDLQTVHSTLMTELEPLLLSEIFDTSLPTISLTEYMSEPLGYVVLNNRRADTYARPFWRFLIQTAIDLSMEHPQRQYFILDEFDKMPRISNLDELASAGRSAGSLAVLAAQDAHQLDATYPDLGRSIYSNCPNRAVFACGDEDTAELALGAIGRDEVTQTTVSQSAQESLNPDQGINRQRTEKYPLTHAELMNLDVGEALLHSQEGWWVSKITEPEL
jgi:type IV secretory pathway TraG/TraD family ATPase VirD4